MSSGSKLTFSALRHVARALQQRQEDYKRGMVGSSQTVDEDNGGPEEDIIHGAFATSLANGENLLDAAGVAKGLSRGC